MDINRNILKLVETISGDLEGDGVFCNEDIDTQELEIAKRVSSYIQSILEEVPILDAEKIKDYILKNNIDHTCYPYIAAVLCQKFGFNPFDLYSRISKDDFWIVHSMLDSAFLFCDHTEAALITSAINNVYEIVNGDMVSGMIGSAMAEYYKDRAPELKPLLDEYVRSRSKAILWFICYAFDYFADYNAKWAEDYLMDLLQSKNLELMSAGVALTKNIVTTHWDIASRNIKFICLELSRIDFSNSDFEDFAGQSVGLLYDVSWKQPEFADVEQLSEIVKKQVSQFLGFPRYVLALEIFRKIYKNPSAYNAYDAAYVAVLSKTPINNNKGLIDYIDSLLEWGLDNLRPEIVWENISAFLEVNPKAELSKSLDSVCNTLMSRIQDFLPYIYSSIRNAKDRGAIGIQLIDAFAFHDEDTYALVKWEKGIVENDVVTIAKKVFVSCLNAKFMCYWGTCLSQILNEKHAYEEYLSLYQRFICDNYPGTALAAARNYSAVNKMFSEDVIAYCESMSEQWKRASKIKDFAPSHSRMTAYRIEQAKLNAKIADDSQSKSALWNLVSHTNIKYGTRSAIVQRMGTAHLLKESDFMQFEWSIEMPKLFLADPLYHYQEIKSAFAEE